ncbi:histidinol-phosphatase HisJ [Thalassobacillus pellis]|uniref:histidinol-phosphatase HisJ n=1 Tax=Thalassobacillus pellis TaxID=748008 RepID=UPI001961F429|nr:histidinol-phosphatase HisJ [Thalassobacillus pellis]MBM7554946.1 histidinol-phosphatase (PHP family) [Thalassobacillus pellis]
MLRDGHIHTPYCPHGSRDSLKSYVEEAINKGFTSMTFTEHAPLPKTFTDPVPDKDSGMEQQLLESYITKIKEIKKEYQKNIDILLGFEVDYIEGHEPGTRTFLNEYGSELDDSILSVHFLKGPSAYHCIDFSPESFLAAVDDFGSIEMLYNTYFATVEKSVSSDLGVYKPERIGHMSLVRKFHQRFPSPDNWDEPVPKLLRQIAEKNYQLDYNAAGFFKSLCQESYPAPHIAEQAVELGIPLIYGSDAHISNAVGQGFNKINQTLIKG